MKKVSKETIIRTVLLVIALINQFLVMSGKSVLPLDDEFIENMISTGFTAVTALWAWWKNNSFTRAALIADEVLKEERERGA